MLSYQRAVQQQQGLRCDSRVDVYRIMFSQMTERFGTALAEGSTIPLPSLHIGPFAVDDPVGHIAMILQSAL